MTRRGEQFVTMTFYAVGRFKTAALRTLSVACPHPTTSMCHS